MYNIKKVLNISMSHLTFFSHIGLVELAIPGCTHFPQYSRTIAIRMYDDCSDAHDGGGLVLSFLSTTISCQTSDFTV